MRKILIGLGVLVLAFLAWNVFSNAEGVQVGKVAPEFESKLQDGSDIKLSDFRGSYVLVDFWGSWCAPCRRENPSLVKLYKEFENKKSPSGEGFEILSVALEKSEGRAEGAIYRDNLYWKNHIITISRIVLLSPIAQKYKVSSIPAKFLINPDGKIMSINPSASEISTILNKYMN